MQIQSNQLIAEMLLLTEHANKVAKQFKGLDKTQLNFKSSQAEWSILECLEHLNLYGDFYLPEIEKQIIANANDAPSAVFKSGLIGNYFAELMKGKRGRIKKMQSPKDKNPAGHDLPVTTIDRFLKQQELLKSLLLLSKTADLNKTKVSISLTKLIKLRLGDTFRFYVYHIERHIAQAERIVATVETSGQLNTFSIRHTPLY